MDGFLYLPCCAQQAMLKEPVVLALFRYKNHKQPIFFNISITHNIYSNYRFRNEQNYFSFGAHYTNRNYLNTICYTHAHAHAEHTYTHTHTHTYTHTHKHSQVLSSLERTECLTLRFLHTSFISFFSLSTRFLKYYVAYLSE